MIAAHSDMVVFLMVLFKLHRSAGQQTEPGINLS